MKYVVGCPVDNKPCDMKIYKRDDEGLTSGRCRHGEFGEKIAIFPKCVDHLNNSIFNPEDKFEDRKKKSFKVNSKRKVCGCKK